MSPKVSVLTCSYNRPEHLRLAVQSLRDQTDPDWEHLIYDDCSTDTGVEAVLAWARQDARVRVWRGERNLDRPSVLWNFLADRACGRYLTLLDDDNQKLPRFIEVMSGELDRDSTLDLVTCGFIVVKDGEANWEHHHNLHTVPEVVEHSSTCEGGAMLCRREAFEKVGYYSEVIRTNEDWDWVRRAVRTLRIRNLPDCYTVYRQHETNRQLRANVLGHASDVQVLKERTWPLTFGLRIIRPCSSKLTQSQEDVVSALCRAVKIIPWLSQDSDKADLALVVSPFQLTDDDIRNGIGDCPKILSYHMEDPYALWANLERVKCMVATGREVWVSTNDSSAVPAYRELVGNRVIVCPSLGPDTTVPFDTRLFVYSPNIDILFCGYAYPSRKRFMDKFLPLVADHKVVLVGDGWEGRPVEVHSTQTLEATYRLHSRARAVVCLQRIHGDCSDGPVEPQSVCRGFMEGYTGPRVFLDRTRSDHPFEDGDVVWFDGPEDLAVKLQEYLSAPIPPETVRYTQRCERDFTYRTRLIRLINSIRAPRVLPVIP